MDSCPFFMKKFDVSFFQPIKIRMAVEVKDPIIELLLVLIFIITVKMEMSKENVAERKNISINHKTNLQGK